MDAIGGYVKGLREGQDLSFAEVAVQLKAVLGRNVDPTTVWRIENAKQNPGADLLLALLRVLRGRLGDLATLFNEAATAADGEILGRRVASGEFVFLTDEEISLLERLKPAQRGAAIALLRQMLQESQ